MKEEFLHYIFEYQFLENKDFQIISSGIKNTDAGPDFFNAKIKIDDTIWAGNVEIHINASDWKKHNHHKDAAYDNIILHLVLNDDAKVFNSKGNEISNYIMKFPSSLYQKYEELIQSKQWLPCHKEWQKLNSFDKTFLLDTLAVERLERKSLYYLALIQTNKNDWEEAFYQALARGFGGKLNAIPFELLTQSLPLKVLLKHRENILQIEALLFGQAGMLNDEKEDTYYQELQKEYSFLQKKYSLVAIKSSVWKFSKIRPYSFPTIRISQFAQIIKKNGRLFNLILENLSLSFLQDVFLISASEYWKEHYQFETKSINRNKKIGKASFHHIVINTIIPFFFAYAQQIDNERLKSDLLELLTQIPAEKNSIISQWKRYDTKALNALETQSLIELRNEYCKHNRCIDCKIAHKILTLSWNESTL